MRSASAIRARRLRPPRNRRVTTHCHAPTIELALLALGFTAGLLTGRWWSLLLAIALGVWVGTTTEIELNHTFLGTAYALIAAAGIAFGVLLSPRRHRRTGPPHGS